MKRILFLLDNGLDILGGSPKSTATIGNILLNNGYDIRLWCPEYNDNLTQFPNEKTCVYKKKKNKLIYVFTRLNSLKKTIKKFKPSIIHAQDAQCAILAVLFTVINKKYEKIFGIVLIILSMSYLISSLQTRYYLNTKISTPKGQIYTYENNAKATQQLITKINQSKIDKILIYPEGLIINYLSGTKSDDYYNQITPATIETFGEQTIIDRIEETKPEYIVLNNLKLKEFGTGEICDEYAFLFRDYLFEKYEKIDEIDSGFWYVVFKIIK